MGYELKPNKQPATKEDIQQLLAELKNIKTSSSNSSKSMNNSIFKELNMHTYEGNQNEPPEFIE
ncbi:hypothetical protein ACFO25_14555 [Paenactinomyces guangxiensis]|uniref:hypothetical protein n=1 Tax=Paenactinomyces guangxiensis TaxID=1490290 RepID=UPI001E38546A